MQTTMVIISCTPSRSYHGEMVYETLEVTQERGGFTSGYYAEFYSASEAFRRGVETARRLQVPFEIKEGI